MVQVSINILSSYNSLYFVAVINRYNSCCWIKKHWTFFELITNIRFTFVQHSASYFSLRYSKCYKKHLRYYCTLIDNNFSCVLIHKFISWFFLELFFFHRLLLQSRRHKGKYICYVNDQLTCKRSYYIRVTF